MIRVAGGTQWDRTVRVFITPLRAAHNFKLTNCVFLEFPTEYTFSNHGWPWVPKTTKSETPDKERLPYLYLWVFLIAIFSVLHFSLNPLIQINKMEMFLENSACVCSLWESSRCTPLKGPVGEGRDGVALPKLCPDVSTFLLYHVCASITRLRLLRPHPKPQRNPKFPLISLSF